MCLRHRQVALVLAGHVTVGGHLRHHGAVLARLGEEELAILVGGHRDEAGGIASVGSSESPNLEALARVAPDLIVIETFAEELYPQLSRIAPTVVIERPSNAAWKQAFDQVVQAVGRTDEAPRVRERYQEEVERAEATGTVIAFVRDAGDGSFRIDGTGAFAGSVAAEAGYPVDDGGQGGEPSDAGFVEFSGERLSVITGDLIVAPGFRPLAEGNSVAALERNPLWQGLPAVAAGRVLTVPGAVYNGGTYVAAELLLRAIADFLR